MNFTFITLRDNYDNPYFTLNSSGTVVRNVTAIQELGDGSQLNIASLADPLLFVERRASGPFQTDITTRDDVLLAFMSLILLLIIDSMIAAVLLRSKHGAISNFSFSVKQVIQLTRDFTFRGIIPPRKQRNGRNINVRLLLVSFLILLCSLGVEVAILFLTNPTLTTVSNLVATFRIMQPVVPHWGHIRFHARASINRPCEPSIFVAVEQGSTAINGCTQSSLDPENVDIFQKNTELRNLTIISDFHAYGADHVMTIGNQTATFATRVVFVLGDKRPRFMRAPAISSDESEQVRFAHMQFVAYVFSIYTRDVGAADPDMNLQRLRELDFVFDDTQDGPQYRILRRMENQSLVESRRYITTLSGVIPDGLAVLRVAQHYFRASAAVVVTDPDQEDLFLGEGLQNRVAEIWKEQIRPLNWPSLLIAILALLLALVTVRIFAKPVSTPDIAAVYVKHAVGADPGRGPMEISEKESSSFRVSILRDDSLYRIGAETNTNERYDVQEEYT